MVEMINETKSRTLEQRIVEKFDKLQIARENRFQEGADSLFDELSTSISMLLRCLPKADEYYKVEKKKLDDAVIEERNKLIDKVKSAPDEISKQFIYNQNIDKISWEYRDLMESLFMDIIIKFNLMEKRE